MASRNRHYDKFTLSLDGPTPENLEIHLHDIYCSLIYLPISLICYHMDEIKTKAMK